MAQPDLSEVLANRRWRRHTEPFPYVQVEGAFTPAFYQRLEGQLNEHLARGFSATPDPSRFSKNMQNSDAYGWDFPPDIDGPLGLFYSRPWHDLLASLTGVEASGDVNGALHHHQVRSADGKVHRDLGVAWFSDQPRGDGINPMDLRRCTYTKGRVASPDIARREQVRAVTMIFYFGNPDWRAGDGGETGLYRRPDDPVSRPAAVAAPVNNSLLVFANTPGSWHSFLHNRRTTRNSAILWLHRPRTAIDQAWAGAVSEW